MMSSFSAVTVALQTDFTLARHGVSHARGKEDEKHYGKMKI